MHDPLYIEYIQKDLFGTISPEEKKSLEAWKIENSELSASLYRAWQESESFGADIEIDAEKDYRQLMVKREKLMSEKKVFKMNRGAIIGLAAAVITLLGFSYFFLKGDGFNAPSANKINEVIASEDRQEVILPDGSKIVLSKDSKLTYPTVFDSIRTIHIDGNAFLDIIHDANQPFEVLSPHLKTRVLGTTFLLMDVSSGVEAEIVLMKGSLEVSNLADGTTVTLAPEQAARYRLNRLMRFNAMYSERFDWYMGSLNFKNVPLPMAVNRLGKRFGVKFEVEQSMQRCRFTGNLRSRTFEQVISSISGIYGATVVQSQGKFFISGGSCD